MPLHLAILGIDHGHIFGMLQNLLAQGCTCTHWWTDGPAVTEAKFRQTFPQLTQVTDRRWILDDPSVDLILIAAIPADRAALAIEAMEAGKDVMTDKPGCTTLAQLAALQDTQAQTKRIWTVNFSERFQVPAVAQAETLVARGAIGQVVQTINLAPHKQNLKTRPPWFFDPSRNGGILTDIGSHQIDQYLHFTGDTDPQITHSLARKTTQSRFQDFGEVTLTGANSHGYIRVDWLTPDGLPTWGDGRLFLLGTEGTIEVRKYTDIGQPHRPNQLYLVNGTENRRIDCTDMPLPYFPRLITDIRERGETAVPQAHTFRTMRLALEAQAKADA